MATILSRLQWVNSHHTILNKLYCKLFEKFYSTVIPMTSRTIDNPDCKFHGANMGPTWVLPAPDGPHVPCYQGIIPFPTKVMRWFKPNKWQATNWTQYDQMLIYVTRPQWVNSPDSKVHGANMGPIWGRQDPVGPHVGPMNFAIWVISTSTKIACSNFKDIFMTHITHKVSYTTVVFLLPHVTYLVIKFRGVSLAQRQLYECPCASEIMLKVSGKIAFCAITKKAQTMCIILGMHFSYHDLVH